jgi:hypothetical protein
MKTFNDCFYNSENHRGFIETFATVDNEKLTDLIGSFSADDVRLYDIFIKSKIGFLNISPMLESIFNETFSSLQEKQKEVIDVFLLLRYKDLLKVKDALTTEISVDNGVIKTEDKKTETTSKNSISAFNSDDLTDDNENNYSNDTNNVITEKKTDTETTIKNIVALTDFYKQSMLDKIIDFIKDMFTLQVVD